MKGIVNKNILCMRLYILSFCFVIIVYVLNVCLIIVSSSNVEPLESSKHAVSSWEEQYKQVNFPVCMKQILFIRINKANIGNTNI